MSSRWMHALNNLTPSQLARGDVKNDTVSIVPQLAPNILPRISVYLHPTNKCHSSGNLLSKGHWKKE
jgi:hypothetical protein